jgi:hypothetical protein
VPGSSIRRGRDVPIDIDTFAEAGSITALGDFAFFRLEITGGRLVSGFGGAINSARALPALLAVKSAIVTGDRLSASVLLCLIDPGSGALAPSTGVSFIARRDASTRPASARTGRISRRPRADPRVGQAGCVTDRRWPVG